MASLIEELIDTLDQEYNIYQHLIPIANQKTHIIIQNDLLALQKITRDEQDAVEKINSLEHKRETVIKNIGTVINKKSENLDLKTVIKLLENQPKEHKALSILHDNLKTTIQRLVEINNRNKSLIQQSLEMIEFNMNFIQSTRMSPGNNTYTKGASRYDVPMHGAGMFDAKQ
ncbi:MAG: hypothetical protein K0S47_770 [Herbinix sp.]|nr:hypothetical protein [Herbinix sp.]